MCNNEDEVLLEIFPNEIWEHILEHVKEPQDYHNLCNASPYFRDLLLPRAPEIMFPQVAKPILHQVQEEIKGRSKVVLRNHLLPYRLVCRAWRQGIDQVLQTQHFNPNFLRDGEIFVSCEEMNVDTFSNPEDISKFMTNFESTHAETKANPFICRAVKFSMILEDDEEEERMMEEFVEDLHGYLDACLQLLRKYGHHIWSCVIDIDVNEKFYEDEDEQIFQLYELLRGLLKRMRNIQHLEFQISGFWGGGRLHHEAVRPLPTLPQLCFLNISGSDDDGWVWTLLQTNPQVEVVDARANCWSAGTVDHLLEHATNLKAVALCPKDREQLDAFCDADVDVPVENLSLDVTPCFIRDCHWQHIFVAVQSHFSSSLKQLYLSLPKPRTLKFEWVLELPQLKTLELETEEMVPLDFLLPLKDTLEQLSIQTSSKSTDGLEESGSTVKLYEFWEKLEMSNAWELFPKLKLLRTGKGYTSWYSCTRDQWEKRDMGREVFEK